MTQHPLRRSPQSAPHVRRAERRAGVVAVLMVLLLTVVAGMVAFSVDTGLLVLLRFEVQNAVDSGALAAALSLQKDPENIALAEAAAKEFVQRNRAGAGLEIPADAIQVEHGRYDKDTDVFTLTDENPNAVRVFARQDNERYVFARLFGHTTFGAPAEAIACGMSTKLDIMMVLDLSGSMADYGRIEALRNAAPTFVDVMEDVGGDDLIGMMGLSADPRYYDPIEEGHTGVLYNSGLIPFPDCHVGVLEARLTDDFARLKSTTLSPSNLEAGKYGGYTGTGAATVDAAHYLKYGAEGREDAKKYIVLMSDGYANKPTNYGPQAARIAAQYAASQEVTLYTISLGNEADVVLMNDMAALTGGMHFDARGSGEAELTARLTEAFRSVAAAIKRAELVD